VRQIRALQIALELRAHCIGIGQSEGCGRHGLSGGRQ
jgi:hypothetical protein